VDPEPGLETTTSRCAPRPTGVELRGGGPAAGAWAKAWAPGAVGAAGGGVRLWAEESAPATAPNACNDSRPFPDGNAFAKLHLRFRPSLKHRSRRPPLWCEAIASSPLRRPSPGGFRLRLIPELEGGWTAHKLFLPYSQITILVEVFCGACICRASLVSFFSNCEPQRDRRPPRCSQPYGHWLAQEFEVTDGDTLMPQQSRPPREAAQAGLLPRSAWPSGARQGCAPRR